MRYKKQIIAGTVILFAMIIALTGLWLTKIREIDIDFSSDSENGEELYAYIDEKLNSDITGENILFFKESEIYGLFKDNPYIEITSVKKVFPSSLYIGVTERKEYFGITENGEKYILDKDYFVLSINGATSDKVIDISLTDINYDFSTVKEGETLDLKSDLKFKLAAEMFDRFPDKRNTVKSIVIDGEKDRVSFNTTEGVDITVIQASSMKAEDIDSAIQYYLTLESTRKISGTILVMRDALGNLMAPTHTFG